LEVWGKGHVSVGALTFQTAQYTASYVTKKLGYKHRYQQLDRESGELSDMVQPRAFISNGGGRQTGRQAAIGKLFLKKHVDNIYAHDKVMINGKAQKPPKYYDNYLSTYDERRHKRIKEERLKNVKPQTAEQLRARAINARARKKLKPNKI